MITGRITKQTQEGQSKQLTFQHTTVTVFFPDINEAGKWVRAHGGELGRIEKDEHGTAIAREALFPRASKLPKWAQP